MRFHGMVAFFVVLSVLTGGGRAQSQPKGAKKKVHENHLAGETSPYLLSHKHNPVQWYPWGKAALALAKKENKPIFLSIGYSACHWCHVMERESFENEKTAALMNKFFVNIKVDREERPDLDEIYMAAVTRMNNGQGGWPMSVFLTPDLKPFYGGTYYPPEDKHGRLGFPRVLVGLGKAWQEKRDLIEKDANSMASFLRSSLQPSPPPGKLNQAFLSAAAKSAAKRWDAQHGGFGRAPRFAPKFPHANELRALLLHYARTKDKASLKVVETTLTAMRRGGIYDQLAGGFHRYSVDREWLVPHFEKMLYDNSLLVPAYLDAYRITGKALYRETARDTLDYLVREMQDPAGGFWSTTDADSEGVEGKYFIWSKAEVDRLLGDQSPLFCAVYGVTEHGNWHEMPKQTVLSLKLTDVEAAEKFKLTQTEVNQSLRASRMKLLAVRGKRVPPGTDDKVLAAWNGMVIAALAQGYQVLGEPRYLAAAQRAAVFMLTKMQRKSGQGQPGSGRLFRTWRKGEPKLGAYLEDYGFLADGLLHLFEADFDPRWLAGAKRCLDVVQKRFLDPKDGNFFFTANDHETLIARSKSAQESSIPSGTAMAIAAFARAGLLLADQKFVDVARRALEANHAYLERYPSAVVTMLPSVDLLLNDPREVVIAGAPKAGPTKAFLAALRQRFPSNFVVTVVHDGNRTALTKLVPAHEGKSPVDGKPAAYVCKFGVCAAPVTAPQELDLGKSL